MRKLQFVPLVASIPVLSLVPSAATAADGLFGRLFESAEPEVSQSIWREDDAGEQQHQQSNLRCPESLGPFDRTHFGAFDGFGFDVDCQYDDDGLGRITLYLTQINDIPIRYYFEEAVFSAEAVTQGATRLEGEQAVSFTNDPKWQFALYEMPNDQRTGVWVTEMSGWALKYRATYDAAHSEATFDALSELSELAELSAGAHLSACAMAERPIRQGTPIEDMESVNALAVLAGFQMMAAEGGAPEFAAPFNGENAPVWCVEDSLVVDGRGFLLWRNITSDGVKGPTDRVTATSLNESPALEVIADPSATAVQLEGEGIISDSTVFTLAIRFENVFEAYGFFVDRPDWATLGAFADDVFTRGRAPLTSYEVGSRQLNMNLQEE